MFPKDLLDGCAKISGGILTLYGLVRLPVDIATFTKSPQIGIASFVLLMGLFLWTVIYYFLPPRTLKRFGLRRHPTKPLLIYSKEIAEINEQFKAVIRSEKTLIYTQKPSPRDLFDIIEVSPGEKIDETVYASPDCRVTEFIRRADHTLAVLWQPHTEIIPFVPYNHRTTYQSPSIYGDDVFWQIHHVDLDTGIIDWTFHCAHAVELAVAFQLPFLRARMTDKNLYRMVFAKKRRNCAQPTIGEDRKTVCWKLLAPKKNRSFVCVVFYQGGADKLQQRILQPPRS